MNCICTLSIVLLITLLDLSIAWAGKPTAPMLCSSEPCEQATSERSVKWNPGHYMLGSAGRHSWPEMYSGDGYTYIKGTQLVYGWGEICPTSDPASCDFSSIHADIAELESHGKRAWLLMRQKEFNWRARQGYCAPQDMFNEKAWAFRINENGTDKCLVKLWEPAAMDVAVKFWVALGQEFDQKPAVEGVMFEETALGLGRENEVTYGYDHEQYKAQLKHRMTQVSAAFPTSQVHQIANWLSDDHEGLESLYVHAAGLWNVGIGGPDPRVTSATELFADYATALPLHLQAQRATTFGTPEQFYDDFVAPLKLNYFFWPAHWRDDPDWDWVNRVLPVIKAEVDSGNNTVQKCPSSMVCD